MKSLKNLIRVPDYNALSLVEQYTPHQVLQEAIVKHDQDILKSLTFKGTYTQSHNTGSNLPKKIIPKTPFFIYLSIYQTDLSI